jgi:hypothetical protein
MVWDVGCLIAGIICIIGPIGLIFWYFGAAREQVRRLNENNKK